MFQSINYITDIKYITTSCIAMNTFLFLSLFYYYFMFKLICAKQEKFLNFLSFSKSFFTSFSFYWSFSFSSSESDNLSTLFVSSVERFLTGMFTGILKVVWFSSDFWALAFFGSVSLDIDSLSNIVDINETKIISYGELIKKYG